MAKHRTNTATKFIPQLVHGINIVPSNSNMPDTRGEFVSNQWRIQDFPEVGAPTPQGRALTYDFAKISQKLHEIERIWTPGGRMSKILLCRSATANDLLPRLYRHYAITSFAIVQVSLK